MTIQTGLDRFFNETQWIAQLKGQRLGLLIHAASVDKNIQHALTLFNDHPELKLTQLYGPEHGIWATAQDMDDVDSGREPFTGLPVVSLYGDTVETLQPKPQDLESIDTLIIDLQDIGARYYTYIYTMYLCMKVCAQENKKVMVLDRPNPINGIQIEGGPLEPGFESFVGLISGLPVRHGMTIGELAYYFNQELNLNCDLSVVEMKGWQREMYFDQTGLPWVLPSPNMPTLDTAIVYPGMCLIEATEVSEARGCTRPFELVGAPYINGKDLAEKLNDLNLPGIQFRPTFFRPTHQKWKFQDCGGVQLHVTDRHRLESYEMALMILTCLKDLYGNEFEWREKPYEFVTDQPAIDLLTGNKRVREILDGSGSFESKIESLRELKQSHQNFLDEFEEKREKYFLYGN